MDRQEPPKPRLATGWGAGAAPGVTRKVLSRSEYIELRRQLDDLDAKLASLRYAERERR